jgi:hypothetical protein
VTRWAGRKWPSGGLERRAVAALAEAHKVINRPKAKTDRIDLLHSVNIGGDPAVSVRTEHVRTERLRLNYNGFTIDQVCGIGVACPPHPPPGAPAVTALDLPSEDHPKPGGGRLT